jgi:hypothetical protein
MNIVIGLSWLAALVGGTAGIIAGTLWALRRHREHWGETLERREDWRETLERHQAFLVGLVALWALITVVDGYVLLNPLPPAPPPPPLATAPAPPPPAPEPLPPLATAPPAPPAAEVLGNVRHGIFWNTFLSRQGEDNPTLVVGAPSSYVLTLDLSAYNYADFVRSAVPGAAANRRFGEYLTTARPGSLEIKIRPIVIGGELTIEGPPIQKMTIAREKLVWPRTAEAAQLEADLLEEAHWQAITVGELSKGLSAGTVSFPVRAQTAGCAAILFTIWNMDDIPLDQVLLRLPVYRNDDRTDCPIDIARDALSGGFATFLDPQLGLGPKRRLRLMPPSMSLS